MKILKLRAEKALTLTTLKSRAFQRLLRGCCKVGLNRDEIVKPTTS